MDTCTREFYMAQRLRLICCSVPSEPTANIDFHHHLLYSSTIYKEILETSSRSILIHTMALTSTPCLSCTICLGKKLSVKSSTIKFEKKEPLPHLPWTSAQTAVIGLAFPTNASKGYLVMAFHMRCWRAFGEVIQHQIWWTDTGNVISKCHKQNPDI